MCCNMHFVEITDIYSHRFSFLFFFFCRKFMKATHLLKKSLSLIWRGVFQVRVNFSFFHNVILMQSIVTDSSCGKSRILLSLEKYYVKLIFSKRLFHGKVVKWEIHCHWFFFLFLFFFCWVRVNCWFFTIVSPWWNQCNGSDYYT